MGVGRPLTVFLLAASVSVPGRGLVAAQEASPLSGVWTLNRSLSEFPSAIGFAATFMPGPGVDGRGRSSGGRGGRGSGSSGTVPPAAVPHESYEDAQQEQFLVNEIREPAARLTIDDTPAAVTITNERGQSRTIHPNGVRETIEIQGISLSVTSGHVGGQLILNYHLSRSRDIRYVYSTTANPRRLAVDVQLLERGSGDRASRVYDPEAARDTTTAADSTGAAPPPGGPLRPGAAAPAKTEALDTRPGAELKGITRLGVVVEDLSVQSAACGLSLAAIENAMVKRLTDGGLTVRRNSDDDTYLYVNIATNTLPGGVCVSRYDAFLYTQGTVRLSYRDQPVLAQVSLAHRGGIASGAPAANAAEVVRGLEGSVDLFVTQIRDANK